MAPSAKPTVFGTVKALSSQRPLTYSDLVAENLPYEPFLVNRAFSLSEDTVLAANMMNHRPQLDKEQQATFYIHAIRPRRRFEAWPKSLVDDEIRLIAEYYGMSYREAKLHADLHNSEAISVMRDVLDNGAKPSRFRS